VIRNKANSTFDNILGNQLNSQVIFASACRLTICFSEFRAFRYQKWRSTERIDLTAGNGTDIAIPYQVNKAWTHAVPKTTRAKVRRISNT